MLEKEFEYFKTHHDDLFRDYPDKYLVIKDDRVVAVSETFESALELAISKGFQVGEFLVQLCSRGDEAYTQTFHSRAIFA